MGFEVINNPKYTAQIGFSNAQFRKLDDLYCRAAEAKTILYRTVECDFDRSEARYTYYKSKSHAPLFTFIITKVGPRTLMYEVYEQKRGRISKSGVFDVAFKKMKERIESL